MANKVAILGAGVIGCGWAARFQAFGWDVAVYDVDPAAEDRLQATIARARRFVELVYPSASFQGQVTHFDDVKAATAGAVWVQECLPERLELKQSILAEVQDGDAIVASSTSGFTPTALGQGFAHSDRLLVCHPFNPVYLLPLVEVVPHARLPENRIASAEATLLSIGMAPLRVRREIDAHIADRLLEAVWREALWLIKDGVATTQDIDTAITHGFGLRWAQMGLFETYRLGGGEAGMAQFLSQFGPALQWPWSRLTDVPELDEDLIQQIVDQSDEQSGHLTLEQLASQRDQNLVAVMGALKALNWGVGAHLRQYDR